MQTDGWPERSDWKDLALSSEQDMESAKRVILTWTKDLRAQPEVHTHIRWVFMFYGDIPNAIIFLGGELFL